MTKDWYTRVVVTLILVALAMIAMRPSNTPGRWLQAVLPDVVQAQPQQGTIPQAWGKIVAADQLILIFEASDGTLRFTSLMNPTQVTATLKRN